MNFDNDDLLDYLIATDTIDEFLGNDSKEKEIKENDRIKTKDGRVGTVMGIYSGTTGLEVEFDDNAPETETIDLEDIDN